MAATLLFSNAISETYQTTADVMSTIKLNDKLVIKKSLVDLMKQSFFHGANRFGTNFIA